MIILVTGSRYATYDQHYNIITRTLAWAVGQDLTGQHELWDGEAAGVDSICHAAAVDLRWKTRRFPAKWKECDPNWVDPLTGKRPCQASSSLTHVPTKRYANGDPYCPIAGFRRNQEMVDALVHSSERKVCVAFPIPERGSRGTADCLTRAWRAGVPTLVIPLLAGT